jgi:hypothetical protein
LAITASAPGAFTTTTSFTTTAASALESATTTPSALRTIETSVNLNENLLLLLCPGLGSGFGLASEVAFLLFGTFLQDVALDFGVLNLATLQLAGDNVGLDLLLTILFEGKSVVLLFFLTPAVGSAAVSTFSTFSSGCSTLHWWGNRIGGDTPVIATLLGSVGGTTNFSIQLGTRFISTPALVNLLFGISYACC